MWSMPQYEMTLPRHDVQATPFHTFRRGVLWIRWWSWCLNCTLGLFMVSASAKQADLLPSGDLRSQHPHEHMDNYHQLYLITINYPGVLLGYLRCPTPAFENSRGSILSAQKLQATVSSSTPTSLEAWDAVFQETSSQLVLLCWWQICLHFVLRIPAIPQQLQYPFLHGYSRILQTCRSAGDN